MPTISTVCLIIPGKTSQLRCVPAYEAQIFIRRGRILGHQGEDLPHTIDFPEDLPATSRSLEVENEAAEINRLVGLYGFEEVSSCFPPGTPAFSEAFRQAAETPIQEAPGTPPPEDLEIPDEFKGLGVKLPPDQIQKLLAAGLGELSNLAQASVERLVDHFRLTRKRAEKLVDAAKAAVAYAPRVSDEADIPSAPVRLSAEVSI